MSSKFPFFTEDLKNWDKIHEYGGEDGWIYRGHKRACWSLESSLERLCKRLDGNLEKAANREQSLMREFRRRYHHYSLHVPESSDDLQWLALMQHHGAPTRLLDWTYSIHIAAYFALEESTEDCAVWAMRAPWSNEQSAARFENDSRERFYLLNPHWEKEAPIFRKTFMKPSPQSFVCPLNPFHLNERLTVQKGIFVIPGNVGVSFEENLYALDGHDSKQNLFRLVLKHEMRTKAIKELYSMNITRASLFPGLDGFAQSLKVYYPEGWGNPAGEPPKSK